MGTLKVSYIPKSSVIDGVRIESSYPGFPMDWLAGWLSLESRWWKKRDDTEGTCFIHHTYISLLQTLPHRNYFNLPLQTASYFFVSSSFFLFLSFFPSYLLTSSSPTLVSWTPWLPTYLSVCGAPMSIYRDLVSPYSYTGRNSQLRPNCRMLTQEETTHVRVEFGWERSTTVVSCFCWSCRKTYTPLFTLLHPPLAELYGVLGLSVR